MKTQIAAAASVFLLVACGGGGNDQASFSQMQSRGEALIEKIEGQDETPVASMPATGTATYRGIAGFAAPEAFMVPEDEVEFEVLSEATLTADFGASTIAGSLTNFRDYENTAMAGSVSIDNGQIADNSFAADLAGTVGDKPVEGILNGGFLGADAKTIVGFIEGTIGGEDVLGILGAEQ